jgi:hypothetical protein
MAGFCDFGCNGVLTIDGVELNTAGWDSPQLAHLWFEFDVRGENRLIPHLPGRRAYPQRIDETEHDMYLVITGNAESDGTPYADPWEGFSNNLQILNASVFEPPLAPDAVRAATLTVPFPGGDETWYADVQVSSLRRIRDIITPEYVEFRYTLTIPEGRFQPAGS